MRSFQSIVRRVLSPWWERGRPPVVAAARRRYRPGLEALEDRSLPSTCLALDFGSELSPAADGFTAMPIRPYSEAAGYGWTTTAGITARDYRTGDALTRDFHSGLDHTFRVDLESGDYSVTVTLGDPRSARSGMAIWANGQLVAENLSTAAGQSIRQSFDVDVSGGQLDLRLVGAGTGFALCGLEIEPASEPVDPPVAPFTFDTPGAFAADAGPARKAMEGEAITFVGTVSGGQGDLSYVWNFGDGTTASGTLTPTHVYQDNGIYQVTLTVTDAFGEQALATTTAHVYNAAPTVELAGPVSGGYRLSFQATAHDSGSMDRQNLVFTWDFGDGTTGTGANPSHTYLVAGTYTVSVQVKDKDGSVGMASTTATVVGTPLRDRIGTLLLQLMRRRTTVSWFGVQTVSVSD